MIRNRLLEIEGDSKLEALILLHCCCQKTNKVHTYRHKYILHHANILLSKCFERLEKLKQYDVVSGIADFKDCAFTDECDHLINQKKG